MTKKITSIVAHVDHGKTTLMDSLVAFQGHISKSLAGDARILDNRNDEREREITLKLSLVRLQNGHVFIDTPGHVDFESLICCSSILADNFIIIIDVSEGIMARTYSLIKYIDKNRTILVLNKVDLSDSYMQIEFIVEQINGLIGCEVFEWNKNNIILCSAYLCAGVCYGVYKLSKKNSMRMAYMSFTSLKKRYEENDVENILKKYNIKYKSKKAVFSSVMPLCDAIFNTIEQLCDNSKCSEENKNVLINNEKSTEDKKKSLDDKKGFLSKNENEVNDKKEFLEDDRKFKIEKKLYKIEGKDEPDALGITVYGILDKKDGFEIENVFFLVRILKGEFRVGQRVFSITNNEIREVVVEKVYFFSVNKYVEREKAGDEDLIVMKGNFLKNSIISTNILKFQLREFQKPFFSSVISLENILDLERIKKVVKAISFTEQCLRVKKNKYNELEFWCGGRVQFEKICYDLKEAGFNFKIGKSMLDLKEYANGVQEKHFVSEEIEFKIRVERYKENECDVTDRLSNLLITEENCLSTLFSNGNKQTDDGINIKNIENDLKWISKISKGNLFLFKASEDLFILESVLEIFISQGPLVRENITGTKIIVELIKSNEKIYNVLKNELCSLYLNADPRIAPRLYRFIILFDNKQIGIIYTILEKYYSVIEDEYFEDETGFYKLIFKVTQFEFESIVEEIHVKTKGMAYIELEEAGYCFEENWDDVVKDLRESKGMYVNNKIIEDPEKQRTFKK